MLLTNPIFTIQKPWKYCKMKILNCLLHQSKLVNLLLYCPKKNIEIIDILDFVYNDMLANSILVYPNSQSIKFFTELCQKYNPKGNRVFDIEIASITYALGIKNIATFNTKDFENITEINLINS